MPKPPFDVSIRVEGAQRGVHAMQPIAEGAVDAPMGLQRVVLGVSTPKPGDERTAANMTQLVAIIGEVVVTIDVTDMLERIGRELHRPEDRPPREIRFRRRGHD